MTTHKQTVTLRLLGRGWTTALQSAEAGGYWSLSQRVGQWKRQGIQIIDKWIDTPHARIKAYRIKKGGKA